MELFYYSTNNKTNPVSFPEALLQGLAPDKGLFMPEKIPALTHAEKESLLGKPYPHVAHTVLRKYLDAHIPAEDLKKICEDAYQFPVPLEKVHHRSYVMRLDQGPTASFKDFAARMMGRLMNWFLLQKKQRLLILTATSGDTGSAVANAFYGLENIDVVVLYPRTEVTEVQRKQMTTLGKNIHVIALDGKFDDCQALVKQAFVDPALSHLPLSSANSINIGRLLPQSVFYFYAWSHIAESAKEEIIFSVPSGNFGNLMGGLIAREMGMPVRQFIISTNANREVPDYLNTGNYKIISPSLDCISSAMNVGHPSNMARIIALYGGRMDETGQIHHPPDFNKMQKDFKGYTVSDDETTRAIWNAWDEHQLLLEPHGAVAWEGLGRFQKENPEILGLPSVSLETAHPAKFPECIRKTLGFDPAMPDSLKGLEQKEEFLSSLPNSYEALVLYLKDKFSSL